MERALFSHICHVVDTIFTLTLLRHEDTSIFLIKRTYLNVFCHFLTSVVQNKRELRKSKMCRSVLDQYQNFSLSLPASGTVVWISILPTKTNLIDLWNETRYVNSFNNSMSMCWVHQKFISAAAHA